MRNGLWGEFADLSSAPENTALFALELFSVGTWNFIAVGAIRKEMARRNLPSNARESKNK